jgi:maltose/moltooligosaccharide transporter
MVAGDPAEALLGAAGSDPKSLIVVGNRGLGAIEGHELGSVPAEVVHRAQCDVLIVQIPEDAESEFT